MTVGTLGRRARGCRLYPAAAQAFPNNAQNAVNLGAVAWDSDGFSAPTPNRVTIPAGMAGRYLVRAAISWANFSAAIGQTERYLELDVNSGYAGSVWLGEAVTTATGAPTGDTALGQTLALAERDVVHIEAIQKTGATRSNFAGNDGGTFLELIYLGKS